jgi:hypothetical protein
MNDHYTAGQDLLAQIIRYGDARMSKNGKGITRDGIVSIATEAAFQFRKAFEAPPAVEPTDLPSEPGAKIKRNIVGCKSCGTFVESTSRHQMVFCKCGAIFTDGGREYIRRGGKLDLIEDFTQWE